MRAWLPLTSTKHLFSVKVQVQQLFINAVDESAAGQELPCVHHLELQVTGKPSLTSTSRKQSFILEATNWDWSKPQTVDLFQRFPFQGKLRETMRGFKPQSLEFKLFATSDANGRNRSLLAGFSYNLVDHLHKELEAAQDHERVLRLLELRATQGLSPRARLRIRIENWALLDSNAPRRSINTGSKPPPTHPERHAELVNVKRSRRLSSERSTMRSSLSPRATTAGKRMEVRAPSRSSCYTAREPKKVHCVRWSAGQLPSSPNNASKRIQHLATSSTSSQCPQEGCTDRLVQELRQEVARLTLENEAQRQQIAQLITAACPSWRPDPAGMESDPVFDQLVVELEHELVALVSGSIAVHPLASSTVFTSPAHSSP